MLMGVRVHRHFDISEAVGNGDVSKAGNDDVPEVGKKIKMTMNSKLETTMY